MQWQGTGIVVGVRTYGDTRVILSVFTEDRGLQRGLAKLDKRKVQVWDFVSVTWRARLQSNLGFFCNCEIVSSYFHTYFQDRIKMMCISSLALVVNEALPQNDPHPILYARLEEFTKVINGSDWQVKYLKVELELLAQLGFALDLSRCAVNDSTDELLFISPKTGKAISKAAAAGYEDKLFPLPEILSNLSCGNRHVDSCSVEEFNIGIKILGFFLHRYLLTGNRNFLEYRRMMVKMSKSYSA